MDCSEFWEDIRKEKERYDKLSPTEKLKERIDSKIESIKSHGKQPVKNFNCCYLGSFYLFTDYQVEDILSILEEVKYIINK